MMMMMMTMIVVPMMRTVAAPPKRPKGPSASYEHHRTFVERQRERVQSDVQYL